MKPIVITQETISDTSHEIDVIAELVESYSCRVHIRKKRCRMEELDSYCRQLTEHVDARYLTLHGESELVAKYSFGGYHAPTPDAMCGNVIYSRSCHSMTEAEGSVCDYLFLSPIFNSISKEGYLSPYNLSEVEQWLKKRDAGANVVALGGITSSNVELAYNMGFNGVALLGSVWTVRGYEIERYDDIFKRILKII